MKKKILFAIDSLNLGGAEKSLVTLLNLLDYEKYEVDLQLFSYGGEFEKLLPTQVHLLSPIEYFRYTSIPYKQLLSKVRHPWFLKSQVSFSLKLRTGKYNNIEKSVLLWESIRHAIRPSHKHYDIAIAYAQGLPTFYVSDKVNADKKIAWVNATYIPSEKSRNYILSFYDKYSSIVTVSDACKEAFCGAFTSLYDKTLVIKDILDYHFNYKMSKMESDVEEVVLNDQTVILSVGRLILSKGYDLAIEACKLLKTRGIKFRWYIIGEGNQRVFLEDKITEYGLEDYFILLGAKSNPYPYFKACDIYVQTSKFEGFGITIAEARMFNKPVVTTEFDAVYTQMIPDVNGLVVSMDANAIADGIQKMMFDSDYRNKIINYLKTEKKSNLEELDKFYDLVDG